jgi:cell division protein FtsB
MTWQLVRAGAAVVLTVAVLGVGGQSLARVWQMTRDVDRLERELVTLRAETEQLSQAVSRLQSDPVTIERMAREALGLVKPGERVLVLPPSADGR